MIKTVYILSYSSKIILIKKYQIGNYLVIWLLHLLFQFYLTDCICLQIIQQTDDETNSDSANFL